MNVIDYIVIGFIAFMLLSIISSAVLIVYGVENIINQIKKKGEYSENK